MEVISVTHFGGAFFEATSFQILLPRTASVTQTRNFVIFTKMQVLFEYSQKLGNSTVHFISNAIQEEFPSKYFIKDRNLSAEEYKTHCTRLLKAEFAVNSRLWNHEFHIVIQTARFDSGVNWANEPKMIIDDIEIKYESSHYQP